ncbi:MAG: hypothetical protein ABF664_05040, partial [Liquorilactobacillus satsumensis]
EADLFCPNSVRINFTIYQTGLYFYLVISLITIIWLFISLTTPKPKNIIVAAQRSQLSVQYKARPETIQPGTILTEYVNLHASANYFSVQIHDKSMVKVSLQNLKTHQKFIFDDTGSVYKLRHQLSTGCYQLKVSNSSSKPQVIDIVHTYHYYLNKYPLVVNGKASKTASFIFTAMKKNNFVR